MLTTGNFLLRVRINHLDLYFQAEYLYTVLIFSARCLSHSEDEHIKYRNTVQEGTSWIVDFSPAISGKFHRILNFVSCGLFFFLIPSPTNQKSIQVLAAVNLVFTLSFFSLSVPILSLA